MVVRAENMAGGSAQNMTDLDESHGEAIYSADGALPL